MKTTRRLKNISGYKMIGTRNIDTQFQRIFLLGKYTVDYSNLPERFIKRKITKVKYKAPEYKG